jgi:hypothetical protein
LSSLPTSPSVLSPKSCTDSPPRVATVQVSSSPAPFVQAVPLTRPHLVGGLEQPSQLSIQPK